MRVNWQYTPWFVIIHALAACALFPWFFSWTGVVLFLVGIFVFGVFGIDIGYHRLLTHRSFKCPLWLEHFFAFCGVNCLQDSPSTWVAIHRRHHHFADHDRDPHSPVAGFIWAHIGWLVFKTDDMRHGPLAERYAKDVLRDRFYARLEKSDNWIALNFMVWALYFGGGVGAALLTGSSNSEAVQFGMSLMVWGAALRTVYLWHTTWAVNSAAHIWGYRNHDTNDDSRNNWIVAWLGGGGGWHNNHHAEPSAAQMGQKAGEFDLSWQTIRLFEALGLVTDVIRPTSQARAIAD